MLNCTCVHRTLTLQEAVIFYRPNSREYYAFARDCPAHGAWFDDEKPKSENVNHTTENPTKPVASEK